MFSKPFLYFIFFRAFVCGSSVGFVPGICLKTPLRGFFHSTGSDNLAGKPLSLAIHPTRVTHLPPSPPPPGPRELFRWTIPTVGRISHKLEGGGQRERNKGRGGSAASSSPPVASQVPDDGDTPPLPHPDSPTRTACRPPTPPSLQNKWQGTKVIWIRICLTHPNAYHPIAPQQNYTEAHRRSTERDDRFTPHPGSNS